jgi:phosphatidylserine/phosphatidylglycerophosphate/cardiolipin synthase-like enzyme
MLEAIESATESIGLATYIFDGAGAGERFVDALARSKERGVEVRALIDAVGANYSWPPVSRSLRDMTSRCRCGHPPVGAFQSRLCALGQLWQVLERGCRVWLSSGQFDHSKLMIVDGEWSLFGLANWGRTEPAAQL